MSILPRRRFVAVVSCEHASNAVPAELRDLGLPSRVLQQHVAWDPGALPVAAMLARSLDADLHRGRWSRLVADLNRSEAHARVVPRRTAGAPIPGNALDARGRAARLARYWRPYRLEVAKAVADAVADGACLHFSVHSFVERLNGVERTNDFGILYDPRRSREVAFARALQRALQARGCSARRNFPYFGHTDGLTSHLRTRHAATRYLGFEIELNQRIARTADGQRRLGAVLVDAVREVLDADAE